MPPYSTTRWRRRCVAVTAAASALALLLAGCAADEGTDQPETPDQVTYLTGFGASAHDAFIFVADELGFFEDANIEIDIQLAGGTENYHTLLAGQAQFTYIDFTGMLIDISRGEFDEGDFQALAAVHHNTLVAIFAPESSDIESPQDLEGKRIGAFIGSPTELLLPAYAELSGWEYDEDLVEATGMGDLFSLLPSGNVDALSTFIIQQGVVQGSLGGEPLRVFPFNEVLDDLLGTGLITTTELAEESPDLVDRFREAALNGLRHTIANPEEAIDILQERNPGAVENAAPFVAQIEMMTPYITAKGEDQIGVLEESHVMRCITVLAGAGLISTGMTPDAILGEQTLTS